MMNQFVEDVRQLRMMMTGSNAYWGHSLAFDTPNLKNVLNTKYIIVLIFDTPNN